MMYLNGESGVRNDVGDETSQKIDAEIDVKLSQVDLQKSLGILE